MTDVWGQPLKVGDTVRAWLHGVGFLARITRIDAGAGVANGTDRLILARLDGGGVEQRDSNAVELLEVYQ